MTWTRKIPALGGALLLCGAALAAAPGEEALDWAFRFASAIDPDPSDKGLAQQAVVADWADRGDLDRAIELGRRVEGWRRGVVLADLATHLAREGREKEARRLIGEARGVIPEAAEWRGPRITAHIARALAALGEMDASRRGAARLAENDPRQYLGRAAATMAIAHAARGEFETAIEGLASLDDRVDLDISIGRTQGYLALAEMPSLTEAQRRRALDAARASAERTPGSSKLPMLRRVAKLYRDLDETAQAVAVLEIAEQIVMGLPDDMPMKGPLLSRQARGWAELGERDRAERLLTAAIPLADAAMTIEQPGILADYAATHRALGDEEAALGMFDRSLSVAEALQNARPRALAVVAVTRSMAESELPLDEAMRSRLERLHGGLKAPW